ncbi:hypothetical protein ACGFIU_24675 [Rhodococcus oryzae]|uniref:hypothetical protein n=1 Tax=Rhodococcus oryzae TaxID=2571143 RepID=UPI00371440FA
MHGESEMIDADSDWVRPELLQATFIPVLGAMAWWGTDDVAAELARVGLPQGRAASCRFAVPVGGAVAPRTVDARLIDLVDVLSALRAMDPDGAPGNPSGRGARPRISRAGTGRRATSSPRRCPPRPTPC